MSFVSQLTRKVVFLFALEQTYGVDVTPTGAANAILINAAPDIAPTGEKVERDVVRSTFSSLGEVIGAKSITMTIKVEARGGGLVGDVPQPPDYEPLLLACGMQKTSVVRLNRVGLTGAFTVGETISGGVSLATGTLLYIDNVSLVLGPVTGSFQVGESMTGALSSATAKIAGIDKAIEYRPLTADPGSQASGTAYFYKRPHPAQGPGRARHGHARSILRQVRRLGI